MIKVLHVVLNFKVGGLEKLVIDLIDKYKETVESIIVCLEGKDELSDKLENIVVFELNKTRGLKISPIIEISKIARSQNVDIVHTHNQAPHFYGSIAAKLAGVPVVHTKHGRNNPDILKRVFLNRVASYLTARVVAVSSDAAELCRDIEKISANKIRTILNGIDTSRYLPRDGHAELIQKLGVPTGCYTIGIVARLFPEKDHYTLFKSCIILKKQGVLFRLIVVGDGYLKKDLVDFVRKVGLETHVIFTGTRHDISSLVREFDVFALSSTTEGISLTLLEAMSCQLPVVATDVGGNSEIVIDCQTGFLVPAHDYVAFAEKLNLLLCNASLRKRMGVLGRSRVVEYFSIERMSRQYLDIYSEVLADE